MNEYEKNLKRNRKRKRKNRKKALKKIAEAVKKMVKKIEDQEKSLQNDNVLINKQKETIGSLEYEIKNLNSKNHALVQEKIQTQLKNYSLNEKIDKTLVIKYNLIKQLPINIKN